MNISRIVSYVNIGIDCVIENGVKTRYRRITVEAYLRQRHVPYQKTFASLQLGRFSHYQ